MPHTVPQIVRAAMGASAAGAGVQGYDSSGLNALLQTEVARRPGIRMLMLSTADGRSVAEASSLNSDGRRVAAMANSFLTLGETLSRELAMSDADYATVCTRSGQIVLIRIRADKPLTLTAVADQSTNMAALLFNARECATRLQTALATAPAR